MGRLVLEERGSQYGLANALVQVARVDDVHVVSREQCAQFLTQVHDLPARRVTRFKLDQDVDVAVGTKIVAQHRAEERQAGYVPPLAQRRELGAVDWDSRLWAIFKHH